MPRAGDPSLAGGLPIPLSHNPLQRISYQPPKLDVTAEDFIDAAIQWLEDVFFPAVKQLTGIDLEPFLNELRALTGGISGTANDVKNWLLGLLTNTSPLNPAQLAQNLWPLGIFPDADSIAGSDIWVFDPAVTRTADSSGSLRVTADGTMKAIQGVPTAVVAGQQVTPSVFVQWDGYVGTTAPIQLQIKQYNRVGDTLTFVGAVTVTTLGPTTAAGGWAELSGTYTAPTDGSVNEIRGRLVVNSNATAGTIHFDDAAAKNKLLSDWVSGLPESLQDLTARWQALIDTIHNTLTGATDFGHTLADLINAIKAIPNDFVRGLLGPGTLGGSFLSLVDAVVSGAVGQTGTGAALADVETFISQISSWATQGRYAWEQAGIRNNTPADAGLLPSERSNFPMSSITTQFNIVPGTSVFAIDYIEENMALGVISWIGWGVSGITEFYVNAYKVDLTTSNLAERIHASPNIVGILDPSGTSPLGAFMTYELDSPPGVVAGDLIAYQFITVGGNHTIRGRVSSLPVRANAPIGAPAATFPVTGTPGSPPSSIGKSALIWSQNVPWVGIAVDTGSGSDHHDPFQQALTGPTSIPVADWCDHVDGIVVGEGGNGAPGFAGFYGNPATPGSFTTVTWVRDTHFTGPTVITWDGTTLSIPGFSIAGNNGVDGSGTRIAVLGAPVGRGPGIKEYNGLRAIGGADQTAIGGAGTAPGGAGNGGTWFGLYSAGGPGGPARAWIQFRKGALPGEETGSGEGDTTPPNISALAVAISDVTASGFTLTPSGAVDE
ncbi:hypothetical protein [Mycobacterium intracellulare]|uniref:hypothetical protein n=1 Tax=Mycobacterium intracellulare TaxID=1767 RepID=UPI00080BE34F|nr:hypothetical protein [Mycobacterium intracellulare]OCB15072.1 hypothetical protein A5689_26820 [Mycobacterium intracellulare subsp. yongonense]